MASQRDEVQVSVRQLGDWLCERLQQEPGLEHGLELRVKPGDAFEDGTPTDWCVVLRTSAECEEQYLAYSLAYRGDLPSAVRTALAEWERSQRGR